MNGSHYRLPVEDDGLFFGLAIRHVHVRHSQAVGGRAVGVEEDVHLKRSARLDVEIRADELSVLTDGDAENRFRCFGLDQRDVVLSE